MKLIRHLTLSLFSLCALAASAITAADAFTSAPASVFPLLDRNTRLDMVDYFRNGLSTPSSNLMQGTSVITALAPNALTVRMTDSSTAQIVVLPAGSDSIIVLVSTVATPGLDSTVAFFDKDWKSLNASAYYEKPGWKEWVVPGASVDDVTMQTPFMLASCEIDPATNTLTLTNNLSRFLDPDVYEMISASLRPSLVYIWSGKKFTQAK